MLDRQRCQVSIVDEVAPSADLVELVVEDICMPGCRIHQDRAGFAAPFCDLPRRVVGRQRRGEQAMLGGQAHEGQ